MAGSVSLFNAISLYPSESMKSHAFDCPRLFGAVLRDHTAHDVLLSVLFFKAMHVNSSSEFIGLFVAGFCSAIDQSMRRNRPQ